MMLRLKILLFLFSLIISNNRFQDVAGCLNSLLTAVLRLKGLRFDIFAENGTIGFVELLNQLQDNRLDVFAVM